MTKTIKGVEEEYQGCITETERMTFVLFDRLRVLHEVILVCVVSTFTSLCCVCSLPRSLRDCLYLSLHEARRLLKLDFFLFDSLRTEMIVFLQLFL